MSPIINLIRTKLDGQAGKTGLAVFVREGKVRFVKATTALFAEAMSVHPHELAGVYTRDCRDEWIADDLAHMGAPA